MPHACVCVRVCMHDLAQVKSPFRPSVVFLEVPSLPRGSLVEVQPLCMEVETLALLRRLSGGPGLLCAMPRAASPMHLPAVRAVPGGATRALVHMLMLP